MGKKSIYDKFYTKKEIVKDLIKYIDFEDYECIIEPSAGNGSFSNNINHNNLIAIDIEPENDNIIKQDWFLFQEPRFKNILVIGNPPFGNRNNLSKNFIKKALSLKNITTIAFILPNVFNKYTNQKMFNKDWRLDKIIELPFKSFLLNDMDYHVPCSFFIWTKKIGEIDLRFNLEKYLSTKDFKIVKKNEADFFIMGANPSTIKELNEVHKNNRGYYIKSNINIEKLKTIFKKINWKQFSYSSVNGGVFWLSKPEIIKIYIENKG